MSLNRFSCVRCLRPVSFVDFSVVRKHKLENPLNENSLFATKSSNRGSAQLV